MLRPLPPFRAEPLKKPAAPKTRIRQNGGNNVSIKASRQQIRVARPNGEPALKVLGRTASDDHG